MVAFGQDQAFQMSILRYVSTGHMQVWWVVQAMYNLCTRFGGLCKLCTGMCSSLYV